MQKCLRLRMLFYTLLTLALCLALWDSSNWFDRDLLSISYIFKTSVRTPFLGRVQHCTLHSMQNIFRLRCFPSFRKGGVAERQRRPTLKTITRVGVGALAVKAYGKALQTVGAVHPVRIARIHYPRFVPRVGLPRSFV